ncbi:MAG: hypothetical protein HYT62_04900 [Candidatus Yanofskybacteria bacterium]|nr:hypothetical protein [Candidatus Yanofskybacteria bacterium]
MALNEALSGLAKNFVQRKVTVKTIPDEVHSRTYEGIIIGVAFRRNTNAIVFFTDQAGFAEFAVHPSQGKNKPWYSIRYDIGDRVVDMIEAPVIDNVIPIDKLLGQYLDGVE